MRLLVWGNRKNNIRIEFWLDLGVDRYMILGTKNLNVGVFFFCTQKVEIF